MAIANLQETILAYTLRKADIDLELTNLQGQKSLALYSQADANTLAAAQKADVREFYKALFDSDYNLQETYAAYTEIPDFEEEIDKIIADNEQQLADITAWETQIDAQITTLSTEKEEINSYLDSFKSYLSANTQEDFSYGLE